VRRLLIVCAVAVFSISIFSALGIAQRQASAQSSGDDRAPAVIATGVSVRAVALDSHAILYLTDAAAPNRIFELTDVANLGGASASNAPQSAHLALVAGNGVAGSLGDGGSAPASEFDLKLDSLLLRSGIAVAPDGTMLIADTLNSTIRRIGGSDSSEPGVVRSIAGKWGPRQEVTLSEPLGLALDRVGNLFVSDHAAGAIDVLPFAADSSVAPQLAILAHVPSPASVGISIDGAKAFVASPDTGSIFEIDTQTRAPRVVPGFQPQSNLAQQSARCAQSTQEASEGSGVCPSGLAVDGGGNLFVADAASGRILRVDAKSQQVTTAASGLKSPGDISFDNGGDLYVAEQGASRILKYADMGDPTSNLILTPPAPLPPPPAPRSCPQTAPFNFCDEPTGGATPTQVFTLTNTGTAAVTSLSISISGTDPGDFQAPSNNCGTSLGVGDSCSINLDFAPTLAGGRFATLSVTDAAGDSAVANLSGTGDDYQLMLNGTNQEQSVFQGGMVTFNFNIVPDTVFGGVVSIVCPASSQMPSLTTCTPSATTVTVTPGAPAPFSITFATTYDGILAGSTTSSTLPWIPLHQSGPPRGSLGHGTPSFISVFGGILLLVVGLSTLVLTRSPWHKLKALALGFASVLVLIGCTAILSSCHHSAIPRSLNTPTGVTNLTVQGEAQNAARGNTIILDVVPH